MGMKNLIFGKILAYVDVMYKIFNGFDNFWES
jgi:hypothetical protein